MLDSIETIIERREECEQLKTDEQVALGLDVSKLTVDACLLFPDGKKQKVKFSNNPAGFLELLSFLHALRIDSIHACMEPTGRYHRALLNLLVGLGVKVSLVDTFTVQNHAKSKKIRNKTDSVDSFVLADYCMMHKPQAWIAPRDNYLKLRDIQNRLANIDDMIRQEENRLEAGLESEIVKQDIEDLLGRLYVSKKKLVKAAKDLISEDPRMNQCLKILSSIIGIGEASAIMLLAMIRFDQFENGRKVGAFAGLAPIYHDSGTSIHSRPSISRAGNSYLRRALYFPAMSAMQHNPQLREFAARLKERNKPPKVIICAVMRKLLVLASALLRKQQDYDPNYGF